MNDADFVWAKTPIIGLALLVFGGTIDSDNEPIQEMANYKVGKHKVSGKVIIAKIIE